MLKKLYCCVIFLIISSSQANGEGAYKIGDSVLIGIEATQPQIVNGTLTLVWGRSDVTDGAKFIHIDPGLMGGKIGFGLGWTDYLHLASLRATYMRTWWEPWGAETDANYVGLELVGGVASHFSVNTALKFNVGVFCLAADHADGQNNWLFSWGIGWGL